jgi:lipopolysaccharide biosynthesis glycosyltransferase
VSSKDTITLVVVSDEHYMVLLATLVKSIEMNLGAGAGIDLWIIEDGVTAASREKMKASAGPAITSITWKNIHEVVKGVNLPNDRSTYPLNIYARLFIPYFLPARIEKALYLDADMIVLANLGELWSTDITGKALAAVTDPRILTFDNHWGGILNYSQLGLPAKSKYFNTGVLLINTAMWRAQNITGRIIDMVNANIKYANYPDQYGLNIVLAGQWMELDARWNHFATMPHDMPYIIHFVDRKPIYSAYKNNKAYRRRFYKYLAGTAWKGTRPISETARSIKKMKTIIGKIIKVITRR